MKLMSFEIFVFFILRFYIQNWFKATSAIEAPNSDLCFVQNLINYLKVNKKVATAALNKITSHLWYLSEDLAPLGFFDLSIPSIVKLKMKNAMQSR